MAEFKYDIRAMLRKFGVVSVWDVKAYKAIRFDADGEGYSKGEWDAVKTLVDDNLLFSLDTLKIANINMEGPTKEIKGGQNADTLLKYGKTLTIEMQEALGRYDVLQHIYGVNYSPNAQIATVTDAFPGEISLVGTTFVIDQSTGAKQPINIIIPLYLGDGIFNLTQDAEGDATVFDMNGSILKFESGEESDTPVVDASIAAITDKGVTGNGNLYGKGADNEFYFFATREGYKSIVSKGYRAAWDITAAEE